jgi:nucleoid-associated protein YgaU
MGLTSAAEAKLDARIRPDIAILRSRTPYPRRHRPALAVLPGGADPQGAAEAGRPSGRVVDGGTAERVVAARHAVAMRAPSAAQAGQARPAGSDARVGHARSAAQVAHVGSAARVGLREGAAVSRPVGTASTRSTQSALQQPIRLTRRGRIVVSALAGVGVAMLAALIWFAVAARAQAAGHVMPGTPAAHSMLRVVVRPGDTLWSIATKADPTADPRIVIQQIVDDNVLVGTAITAGQVLWVPRI